MRIKWPFRKSFPVDENLQEAARRVAKGVKLLDEKVPTWAGKIDLGELDLSEGQWCVLGQAAAKSALRDAGYLANWNSTLATPSYIDAVEALDINGPEYGFDVLDESEGDGYVGNYGDLNHLWTTAIILSRRKKRVTAKRLLKHL